MSILRKCVRLLQNSYSANYASRLVPMDKICLKRSFTSVYCNSVAAQKLFNEHLSILESKSEKTDTDFHDSAFQIGKAVFTDKEVVIQSPWLSHRNEELIDYGVQTPFRKREEIILNTFRTLAPKSMQTDKDILNAHLLSFCADLYLWATIVADDIIDGNNGIRRHKPCWHVKIGNLAVMDAIFLLSGIPIVLKNFMAKQPYYQKCSDTLNELVWLTCCLETEDYLCFDVFNKRRDSLTFDFYRQLSNMKMGYGGPYYPVLLGMHMAGFNPDTVEDQVRPAVKEFGYYLMSLNDFIDRYGKTSGKTLDEDIRAGKLSWMLLTGLKHANSEQKALLEKCYGSRDEDKVNMVVQLYNDLKLEEKFFEHEAQMHKITQNCIQKIDNPDVQEVYTFCLNKSSSWYS